MSEATFFDAELLLTPIFGAEKPVGEDLRVSGDPKSSYFTLKDRRASARAAEREVLSSNEANSEPLKAALNEWELIAEVADGVLRDQSKDLEVACWLCEALVRLEGFAGLAGGLELLARLVETYWDEDLYPLEDEDGVETRIAPLSGLIGRGVAGSLVQPMKLLPLSDVSGGQEAALWTIELASMPPRSESAEVRAAQSAKLQALMMAVERSSPVFLRALRKQLAACLSSLDRLMKIVDDKTNLGGFGTQVAQPLEAIAKLLDDRVGALFIEGGDALEPEEGEEEGAEPGAARKSRLNDREDALAAILEVARFFERSEPQSLVAASLQEVVRRARLSAADLILELLPNPNQREEVLGRLGIRPEYAKPE